jgi:predicted MPP superfamily phosphohydrolase
MAMLTWLHISDLHFRASQAYNANVVLKALLTDVQERIQKDGLRPDFVAVTGDVAFSGQPQEYKLAAEFLDKLLSMTGVPKEQLFLVPGNHDVDRKLVTARAKTIGAGLTDRDKLSTFLATDRQRELIMNRFKAYARFVNNYLGQRFDDERYFYVRRWNMAGRQVAVLGLNSAWLCGSDKDKSDGLLIGERQARAALEQAESASLRIALLHHPFDWLREFDQSGSATMLMDQCHFVLHGHLHRTATAQLTSPDGSAMILACGACYETREWPNMCNWVRLNLATGAGTVYLRRYSDARGGFWAPDTLTYKNATNGEYSFTLRGSPTRASDADKPTTIPAPGAQTATAGAGGAAATGGSIANVGSGNINIGGGIQGNVTINVSGAPGAQPPAPPPAQSSPQRQSAYDVQAVRELLSAAFSDEEVMTLAFDRFRTVYEDISGAMGKGTKIRLLVEWCDHYGALDQLLAEVKRRNPNQYARYDARLKP